MSTPPSTDVNRARFEPGQRGGHYESFFQRANHPTRPLAFWIRYTVFSPDGHPDAAVGELWAIWFDGESRRHVAVKADVPIAACQFSRTELSVRIADATLEAGGLRGAAASRDHRVEWDLEFAGDARPLLLLPERLYETAVPRAKALVGLPLARYRGTLTVDGRPIAVTDWVGSQNHNWGSRHTDHYAWGQVAGFDERPRTFLELSTARLRFGPLWTPFFTTIVVRVDGDELALNSLGQALRARGRFEYFRWRFASASGGVVVEGTISAPPDAFVGLAYRNPPGGTKHCLNTKIAACDLRLTRGGRTETLATRHRAAFEILTDDRSHGIDVLA